VVSADTFRRLLGGPGTVPAIILTDADFNPSPTALTADTVKPYVKPMLDDGIRS